MDDWGHILPDFGNAMANIQNFVRDGAKHKALGMLNTEWKDDAGTLRGTAWHGYAWGAECAWNASTTKPEDFNRRLGAVLFGEKGDHFGQAIALLDQDVAAGDMLEVVPDCMGGMSNARFWRTIFCRSTARRPFARWPSRYWRESARPSSIWRPARRTPSSMPTCWTPFCSGPDGSS